VAAAVPAATEETARKLNTISLRLCDAYIVIGADQVTLTSGKACLHYQSALKDVKACEINIFAKSPETTSLDPS
jgi:hypothetical protein